MIRVYIVDKHVRQMVGKVGQDVSGVSDTTMATLHVELQCCAPPLDSFLSWCISNYGTDVSFPPSICAPFSTLGKSSPVCALLPQLDSVVSLYEKLKNDEPIKQFPNDLPLLQQTCPLLFDVISTVEGDLLPSALTLLIKDLLEKAKAPFHGAPFTDSQSVHSGSFQELEYFPCLPVVRSRGNFCLDNESSPNICTKKVPGTPAFFLDFFWFIVVTVWYFDFTFSKISSLYLVLLSTCLKREKIVDVLESFLYSHNLFFHIQCT